MRGRGWKTAVTAKASLILRLSGGRSAALFLLFAVAAQGAPLQQQPTLADLWAGRASFVVDNRLFGEPFRMHFISTWPQGPQLWAYYIAPNNPGDSRMAIGLALTSDGVNFSDRGTVIRVSPGAWDSDMASFPGVLKLGDGRWAVAYEGTGPQSPGDIGLATSGDGRTFVKDSSPILVHAVPKPGDPAANLDWERNNIGTPSLFALDGTYYLFYHGFGKSWEGGQDDCQVGVATGTDLRRLRRHGGNPILRTGRAGEWDSGTVGKRSILREADGRYYMVYEGSTDQPYTTARWSSGLARSSDLLRWEKFSGNPVLPQTAGAFGYDGPEWVRTPDGRLHVYFRHPKGPTGRATLVWAAPGNVLVFEAERDSAHQVGRAEADGWSVRVGDTPDQFMSYGPYTTAVAAGVRTATFRLMLDNVTADNAPVLKIDVYDAAGRAILAERQITRREFSQPLTHQDFSLTFPASPGQRLEFRTYWYGGSYVRQDKVTIR